MSFTSDGSVGIVSYGVALPGLAISTDTIAQAHGLTTAPPLGVKQKTVPQWDEDTITLAIDATHQAFTRIETAEYVKEHLGTVFTGSESHPYAVKPTGTVVAGALGLSRQVSMADLQFACKAGSQSLQLALMYVQAGQAEYGLAIGADTAQSAPADALEYTAAAGGVAFVVGTQGVIARLLGTTSYASDTPDFWRRPRQPYPQHGGRFTGEPAYFHHIMSASQALLEKLDKKPSDFTYAVFHTPNGKFPLAVGKQLGFAREQMRHSLIVENIGNSYAAASLLALTNVLDHAKPGETIFITSYGSGAGADSFAFECTDELAGYQARLQRTVADQISQLSLINYTQYCQRSEQ
jgi:hydroxymethylglutaryl-CoA synthase